MIKREWIKPSNGFGVGTMCLYIDPGIIEQSYVFRLKDLKAEETTHPATGGKLQIKVLADTRNEYGTPMYLDPEGEFYPIESRQFAFWNPGNPEAGLFHNVVVQTFHAGSYSWLQDGTQTSRASQLVQFTNDAGEVGSSRSRGDEVLDRPDWAPGFKL